MWRSGTQLPVCTLTSIAILLALSGCADFRVPRLDPSGDHLFIFDSPPPSAAYCPPGTLPAPAAAAPVVAPAPPPAVAVRPAVSRPPVISPYSDVGLTLSPFRVVEPVGSQVVMLAGVRGGDNYLRTNRRLEWWLMPGSVGQFTAVNAKNFSDYLVGDFTQPRVISATSAVGTTTRVEHQVGAANNRVNVARGQGWVTLSSLAEGVSHVTVVAPDVVLPAERTKSADVYWIDAQFGLPTPLIIPAGGKEALSTTVWRQSNHSPRAGWIVRYEVCGGPRAVFGPTGTPSIEVATNDTGQATAEIFERDPSPGTSQVRLQVFRPADSCGERLMVREGRVLVTWTAPSLGIRQLGPPARPSVKRSLIASKSATQAINRRMTSWPAKRFPRGWPCCKPIRPRWRWAATWNGGWAIWPRGKCWSSKRLFARSRQEPSIIVLKSRAPAGCTQAIVPKQKSWPRRRGRLWRRDR